MAVVDIGFALTDTGKLITDITWDYCTQMSDDSAVVTTGSTLAELGSGRYLLTNPAVVTATSFRLHLTSDADKYIVGVFDTPKEITDSVMTYTGP